MTKNSKRTRPHRYRPSPYGGCRTCSFQENYRFHQSLLWRVFHPGKAWRT